MKGTNTFYLNAETMIEAVQEYFNKRFVSTHQLKVTDVSYNSATSYVASAGEFKITVATEAEKP